MGTVMSALNVAYDRKDHRGFVRRRLVALAMALFVGGAAVLAGALLIMGPHLQAWLGSALDARGAVATAWSIAQWPVLVAALLFAFSVVLYLGPDVEHRRWQLLTPGAVVAVAVWLAVSWVFSVYTARFGTYDKTWGTLGAVIVTLIWLWLAGISLLFGGELNAETERRGRREGGARTPKEPRRAPAAPSCDRLRALLADAGRDLLHELQCVFLVLEVSVEKLDCAVLAHRLRHPAQPFVRGDLVVLGPCGGTEVDGVDQVLGGLLDHLLVLGLQALETEALLGRGLLAE
jgi:virulence factor BrkB